MVAIIGPLFSATGDLYPTGAPESSRASKRGPIFELSRRLMEK